VKEVTFDMQTKIGALCDKILEAGWLVAIVAVPTFFNILSGRIFEPDKLTLLRSVAVLMVAVWLIRLIEQSGAGSPAEDSGSRQSSLGAQIKSTPLVLPTLLLVGVYLLTTIISVSPRASLWGSYQRLQGTYTTFSYIVIFAIMLQTLRTRAQIDRLVTTAILTSVPVSFYAILQHYGLDPLPWLGNVQARVASNMGNSIFVAAYLIMVAPLTWTRAFDAFAALLLEEEGSTADVVRGAIYVFVAFLQLITIFWTGSRGPQIGLFAGGLAFLLVLGFVRRWRWLVWGSVSLAVMGLVLLALLNVPGGPLEPLKTNRYIGRLGRIFETDSGTGKVRVLIWEGAIDLILPHPPLEYPEGPQDALNLVRPLVGYGPEAMWVAYNRFYPPDLAHVERRNASPDRSHNETFDALVITGLVGFVVYMLVFASVFYYGFKWLGLIRNARQRNLFVGLWIAGGLLGAVATGLARKEFIGVGLPAGIIGGVGVYLALATAFAQKEPEAPPNRWYQLLLIALIATVVAHFVEIHFGIAIAATRTYFWTCAALLVVVGHVVTRQPTPAEAATGDTVAAQTRRARRKRARRRDRPVVPSRPKKAVWLGPVMVYSFLVAFLLVVLVYNFVTNQARETVVSDIIWHSLTTKLVKGQLVPSYGLLWKFLLVWLLGGVLAVAELAKADRFKGEDKLAWLKAFLVYLPAPPLAAWIYANWHADSQRQLLIQQGLNVIQGADMVANVLVVFYLVAFLLLLVLGLALYWADDAPKPSRLAQGASSLVHLLILGVAVLVIWQTNVNVIRADIIFKQAEPYEREGIWQGAVQIYEHALEVAPNEDYYYLYLGRAYLELAKTPELDAAQKLAVLEECRKALEQARKLNPLNTDHSANLARLYHTWAAFTTDPEEQIARINQSLQYYEQATNLSPHNAQLFNEWATVYMAIKQFDQAQEKLERSLALDQKYDVTYYTLGDLAQLTDDWEKAAEMYEQGLALKPDSSQRWGILSTIYAHLQRYDDAIAASQQVLERRPNDFDALKNLALLYRDQQRWDLALAYAQKAAEVRPDQTGIHQLLAELYRGVRDFANAEAAYQQALELTPQDINILWGLAMVYWDQARYQDAIAQLEVAGAGQLSDPPGLGRPLRQGRRLATSYRGLRSRTGRTAEPDRRAQRIGPGLRPGGAPGRRRDTNPAGVGSRARRLRQPQKPGPTLSAVEPCRPGVGRSQKSPRTGPRRRAGSHL
jgi:tetratricopeptide (TPR) repeat protein/O-antigen ligase